MRETVGGKAPAPTTLSWAADRVSRVIRPTRIRDLTVILMTSLAVSLTNYRFMPLWYLTDRATIDPWLYWGSAEDPRYSALHLGDTYYFRRWTLIAPAWLAQRLLPQVEAQAALRGLLLVAVLCAVGFAVLQVSRRLSVGLAAILLVGGTSYVVRNIGMQYHQGTGLLIFMICVSLAWSFARSRYPVLRGILFGLFLGLGFITYQFFAYFTPALLLLAVLRFGKQPIRVMLTAAAWTAIGFAIAVGPVDQIAGRLLGVSWDFLPLYSLRVALSFGDSFACTDSAPEHVWLTLTQPWSPLGPALAVAILGILASRRVGGSAKVMSNWSWFVFALTFPYLLGPVTGNNGVCQPWTSIYLTVVLLITTALVTGYALSLIQPPGSGRLAYVSISILLLPFGVIALTLSLAERFYLQQWLYAGGIAALYVVAMLATWGRFAISGTSRVARTVVLSGAASLGLVVTLSAHVAYYYPTWLGSPFSSKVEAEDFYNGLSLDRATVVERALAEGRRVWILDARPHVGWSPLMSSLYGLYSSFSLGYPPQKLECSHYAWIRSNGDASVVALGFNEVDSARDVALDFLRPCGDFVLEFDAGTRPTPGQYWFRLE